MVVAALPATSAGVTFPSGSCCRSDELGDNDGAVAVQPCVAADIKACGLDADGCARSPAEEHSPSGQGAESVSGHYVESSSGHELDCQCADGMSAEYVDGAAWGWPMDYWQCILGEAWAVGSGQPTWVWARNQLQVAQ